MFNLQYYSHDNGAADISMTKQYQNGLLQEHEVSPPGTAFVPQVDEVGRSFPGPEPGTGTITKEGAFEYIAPNQQKYRIDYVADEGGFQPRGDHLPQPPAQIPEYAEIKEKFPELWVKKD